MLLNAEQRDALSELINIGFGRAASALSILVGQRVQIEAPEVNLYPFSELETVLSKLSHDDITSVHQVFSGKIAGDAVLLMDQHSASSLVDMLEGGSGNPRELTLEDRESLLETGNILLNAFTGSFGNLLQVHISFTVPNLQFFALKNMMQTLVIDQRGVEFAMVVRVNFRLTQGDVSGYVIIIMSIQSMEALLASMRAAGFIS